MDEIEIKHEYDSFAQPQCRTCLSLCRKLKPITPYKDICRKITDIDFQFDDILICWECEYFLRKVLRFQQNVIEATELLQHGNSYIPSTITLSTLTTIVINDNSHIIYVNENICEKKTVLKSEQEETVQDVQSIQSIQKHDNHLSHKKKTVQNDVQTSVQHVQSHDECTKTVQQDVQTRIQTVQKQDNDVQSDFDVVNDFESEVKHEKKKNKWAIKRAIQNKKPKFKMIKCKFRRVWIDEVSVKEGDKKYECDKCYMGFNKENKLIKHKTNCQTTNMFICDICKKKFKFKRHLLIHLENHYYRYICTLCDYVCRDKKHTIIHIRKVHKSVFECLKCGLNFGCRREFFKHFKEWHEKFICDYCGIKFKMRYCIKDHIRKQHSPFVCNICNKRFARYNGLWLHNKTNHSTPTAAAYCVECDKNYVDIYRYKWHLANSAKHTPREKLRIPCPSCDKIFSKNIYMKDHYNLVHLKYIKYRCEECDKNFIRNADLVKHKRRVHEGILPPKNKICLMCGRGFTTNKILANHIRTHTGERPYLCACGARFAQRAARAAHARAYSHSAI